jgi:hypothetical protein
LKLVSTRPVPEHRLFSAFFLHTTGNASSLWVGNGEGLLSEVSMLIKEGSGDLHRTVRGWWRVASAVVCMYARVRIFDDIWAYLTTELGGGIANL